MTLNWFFDHIFQLGQEHPLIAIASSLLLGCYTWAFFRNRSRISAEGKAVLITGCDTLTGFGTIAARKLSAMGYVVFAGCLNAEKAKREVYEDLANLESFHIIQLDITNQQQIDAAVQYVETWLNQNPNHRFWALYNNAGMITWAPFEWMSFEAFTRIFNVNLFGAARMSQAFLPLLRKTPGSRLVFMSSLSAHMPFPFVAAYCASKAAVLSLAETLSLELHQFDVKVSAICPDFYGTNLATNSEATLKGLQDQVAKLDDERFQTYGGQTRMEHLRKFIVETMPWYGKGDVSPVVNCVIDAITRKGPKRVYFPTDAATGIMHFLNRFFPSIFFKIQSIVARVIMGL